MRIQRLALMMTMAGALSLSGQAIAAQAKNVILLISDGASWGTWDMASYWQYGQLGLQDYDQFPVKLGMTTTPLNMSSKPSGGNVPQVTYDPAQAWSTAAGTTLPFAGYEYIVNGWTDSAASATAMATGQKTYNNAINWSNDPATTGTALSYITQTAKGLGKATGVVTSVPLSHATPAAFGAQNISRNKYLEITDNMLGLNGYSGSLDVVMGAGHPEYNDNNEKIANANDYKYNYVSQSTWNGLKDGSTGWTLVESKADFEAIANGTLNPVGPVIGVPQVNGTLQQSRSGKAAVPTDINASGMAYNDGVPSLATMTQATLNLLDNDPDGLFMVVESGAVDWAAHADQTGRIIEEQVDFNHTVEVVTDWVQANSSWDETLLLIVTDHGNSTPMGPNSETVPFDKIPQTAAGVVPTVDWYGSAYDHKNEITLMWAIGAGSGQFYNLVDGSDAMLASQLAHGDGRYIDNTDLHTVMSAAMVPEPETWGMLLAGMGLLGLRQVRRRIG